MFASTAGLYLFIRPGNAPDDLTLLDQVVRTARALPVANRRVERYPQRTDAQTPLRWSKWRTNFGAASTGAQVSSRAELLRDVEHPGL